MICKAIICTSPFPFLLDPHNFVQLISILVGWHKLLKITASIYHGFQIYDPQINWWAGFNFFSCNYPRMPTLWTPWEYSCCIFLLLAYMDFFQSNVCNFRHFRRLFFFSNFIDEKYRHLYRPLPLSCIYTEAEVIFIYFI